MIFPTLKKNNLKFTKLQFKGFTQKIKTTFFEENRFLRKNAYSFFTKKAETTEETEENHADTEVSVEKYNELMENYNSASKNLETCRTKFDEIRRAYLEKQDEVEKIKMRMEKETKQAKEFAISKFAKDLLDVQDNFSRALQMTREKQIKDMPSSEINDLHVSFVEGI